MRLQQKVCQEFEERSMNLVHRAMSRSATPGSRK